MGQATPWRIDTNVRIFFYDLSPSYLPNLQSLCESDKAREPCDVNMPSLEKPSKWSSDWFKIGILGLWLISLALRFWGLGRFNTLVFDEVYYVKFAHNYLTHTQFFDGHPR